MPMAMAKRATDECLNNGDASITEKNSNGDSSGMDSPAVEAFTPQEATVIITPLPFSVLPADSIYDIAGAMTTELTSIVAGELPGGRVVAINSASEGGGNKDDLRINIEQHVNVPTYESAMQLITRAFWIVGFLTLVMDVRTVLYKPATGVIFGRNKLAYYVILAVIFAVGIGEVSIAFWMSQSGHTRRVFWIWGFVLFISIWPFIIILGMGGFT